MSLLKPNCREVTRLLIERQDRPLTALERIRVRLHLGICEMCTRFGGQLGVMNRALSAWKAYRESGESDPPPDA
jgi:hypothetical protein